MADTDMSGSRTLAHRAVPFGILAFCGVAYYLTTTFDRVPPILKRGMQPADFPQLIIALMAILAVVLIIRDRDPSPDALPRDVYVSLGLMVAFPILAMVDLFLALGVFGFCLSFLWGDRRWWALLIVALVVPASVFFLFDMVFEIRFPRGLLTNLWYG